MVFTEEVRDVKSNRPADMPVKPTPIIVTAAHEIMHTFYGPHGSPQSDQNLMNGPRSLASAQFLAGRGINQHSLLPTDLQFRYLQSRTRPLG